MANYLDPYAAELQGIQRQQKLAEMLMNQQQPQEQMVSGRVAPINPLQAFLPALNTYQGMNLQKNAEAETKKLADLVRGETNTKNQAIIDAMLGKDYQPAIAPEIQRDDMGNVMPNVQEQSGQKPDMRQALALALKSGTPLGESLTPTILGQLTKQPERVKLGQGETYGEYKDGQFKPLYSAPKEITPSELIKDYEYSVKNSGYKGSLLDFKKDIASAGRSVTNVHTGDSTTNQLSNAFLGQAKPYIEVAQAYRKVISAPESAAGDMSKIFGYMKILDPGSTVREGEAASAQNAAGVPDRILNLYNKALTGQRLNPEQRKDFDNSAYQLVESQKQQFETLKTHFRDRAISQQANPNNVIYDPFQGIEPIKSKPTEKPKQDEFKGTGRGNPFKPSAPRVVDFNSLPSGG
jgi:hypothetical protein